ncbi:MAG: M48 metallopeptidase family protein [Acidimicrobiales bacterium]
MAAPLPPLPVRVIPSSRRKKTVAARIVDGVIEVRVPARLRAAERERHVRALVDRIERKRVGSEIDLTARASDLARRFQLPEPTSIAWSTRQKHRWGSCTPADGTIRISDRMRPFPDWVIDYVIVHELTHLVEITHSRRFHELVDRYPRSERARGFLDAVSLGHADGGIAE